MGCGRPSQQGWESLFRTAAPTRATPHADIPWEELPAARPARDGSNRRVSCHSADAMPVREGDVLDGRFEIGPVAASGGMGVVHRGRDRETGDPVAVKVLRGVELAERFRREAQVLSGLRHPGIVTYLGHGRTADELYLVMEWLEGEHLGARLDAAGLTVDESVRVAIQLASALATGHGQKIVHRDLKPSNIFLADWRLDRVKLLDYGIARQAGNATLTEVGMVVGT